MEGARIGILLGAGRAHAALVGDGEPRHATGPNASERVLARMLRGLAGGTRVGSVTWDVSAELDPALAGTPVAVVRVVPRLPAGGLGSGHPSPLLRSLQARRGAVIGGHDLFGVELAPLDIYAVLAEAAAARGIPALAVTASGAPGCADHELAAAELVHDTRPEARVSLSHQVGGLGLLDREAATVINAALLARAAELAERCVRVGELVGPGVSTWFAAGDGGRISAERLRLLPVLALAASEAAALTGAARLAGIGDALVGLALPDALAVGHVTGGLPEVTVDRPGPGGVRMAVPTASLTRIPGSPSASAAAFALLAEHEPDQAVVAAGSAGEAAGRAHAVAARLPAPGRLVLPGGELAAVGAACTEPTAWLDTVVYAESREELDRQRGIAEQRALTLVAESGARLGSERVVSSRAVSMSFLRSGSYRLMVRAGGEAGEDT
ncbi:hypothetical protein [Nonomuraea wenchangensis]|uniref:Hydantoinase/oxoprolinase n=2 Tax=Nonomuraea wenchangensis TaxID=568860 RepID=A0A1I0LR72_9ACTN|nr:hypothetical protein [Nonomuraea wenchangensis]SEU44499.1 hypothetical protein SAMN05421811_12351 [Nonomuraea wenchangensis]